MAPSLSADKNTPSPCGLAPALFFHSAALSAGPHPKAVDHRNLMIPSEMCVRPWLRRWFAALHPMEGIMQPRKEGVVLSV